MKTLQSIKDLAKAILSDVKSLPHPVYDKNESIVVFPVPQVKIPSLPFKLTKKETKEDTPVDPS